jgi:hypothetical protein
MSLVEPDEHSEKYVVATERLGKTEDGRLVPEGDPEARWFYCVQGARVPMTEAVAGGLVKPPAANKSRRPAGDK